MKPDRDFTLGGFFIYVLPSIFAYIFNGVYTIVDGAFIEKFEGPYAIASVNLYYPVLNLLLAAGLMTGTGGSVALSLLSGKGQKDKADAMFSRLMELTCGFAVFVSVIGLAFTGPLMRLLGATDGNITYFRQYYVIMIAASFAVVFSSMVVPMFFAEGKTAHIAVLTLIGGVLNVALDALFMGMFGWGIKGAATATVIGYSVPALYGLYFYAPFNRHGSTYRFGPTRIDLREVIPVLYNGSSEMVSNLASGATALVMNHLAYRCSGEVGVSVVSVYLYAQFLAMACFMGLTSAVEPVISFHNGSENVPMQKKIYRYSLFWITVMSVVIAVLIGLFHRQIVSVIFEPAGEKMRFYTLACRSLMLMIPACLVCGYNIFISGLFTGYSNGTVSAILSFLRTFVILSVAMVILAMVWGSDGLWISWFAAEAVMLVISVIFLKRKLKFLSNLCFTENRDKMNI